MATKFGETIRDFRGQEWTLESITRLPSPGKDGKVVVRDEFNRATEFYWTVFPEVDFTSIAKADSFTTATEA